MSDITPTDEQWAATKAIVEWYAGGSSTDPIFYLDGPAGTGKSTILKIVRQELRRYGVRNMLPTTLTGKAASVLRKKGHDAARTIHSAIYVCDDDEDEPGPEPENSPLFVGGNSPQPRRMKRDPGDLKFQLNLYGPASEADLIAVDEASMPGDDIGADLMEFGKKVLALGDTCQLPPVRGQGFFTKRTPDFRLTEVHRQAKESPIIRASIMCREGKPIPYGMVDNGAAGRVRILKLTRAHEHEAFRVETQPICGVHRVRKFVTQRIRTAREFEGRLPVAGERIMWANNNRDLNLFNGLQGAALGVTGYQRRAGDDSSWSNLIRMDVQMDDHRDGIADLLVDPWMFAAHFDDVEQPKKRKGIEWADWGYVLTAHKAQGSEWPDVTVIDDSGSFREDRHRWLYTAITRASEDLTILRRP